MTSEDKLSLIAQFLLCEDARIDYEFDLVRRRYNKKSVSYDDLSDYQRFIIKRDYFDHINSYIYGILRK